MLDTNVVKKRPNFASFDAGLVNPQLDALLPGQRRKLQTIELVTSPDWENTMDPLQAMDDELDRFWSPVRHLNSVMNSDAIRVAYNAGLDKLTEWYTDLGQNKVLYERVMKVRNGEQFATLNPAQQKVVENVNRDFKLSGVSLEGAQKARYKEIALRLTELKSSFEENLLDCTNAWTKTISDESELAGLPESAIGMAEQFARDNNQKDGWMLGLEFPLYYAVLTYSDDCALREELYTAYNTRASDQGPHGKKWQNGSIIDEILALRHEKARILGFNNYAQLSTETKMVDSPETVIGFLEQLTEKAKPQAQREFAQLSDFARERYAVESLCAWDVAYYSEKFKLEQYAISDEDLRPYFPADRVVEGMFEVVNRLYGISVNEVDGIAVWHPDVRYFEIRDANEQIRGGFYLDMYSRANKRGGAWMDECVSRCKSHSQLQMPIAYLTCNLSPPTRDKPSLLTHAEVITLFHEFGHGLHHILTQVDYRAVAGINGVEWDAVELPSQFLENWCWQRESLNMISGHYQTGEKIPSALLERAQRAKNFQSAMQMVRQIELSLFDINIHLQSGDPKKLDVQAVLDEVRDMVAVIAPPAFNRFQNGFSHIFAGGYAAGYFSYKWAEVLSADAFSRFEEEGIFNRQTGSEFMQIVLEQGGTKPAGELFVEFRGREPEIDALLRHSGLAA
jgi:oligopeptidase A